MGVVCPGCKVMLRLPGPDEEPGPLVVSAPEAAGAAFEEEDHEDHEEHDHSHEREDGTARLILLMTIPGLLLLGLSAWLMMPEKDTRAASPQAPVIPAPRAEDPAAAEAAPRRRASELVQLEETAKKFLEAATVDEALALVYRPEAVRPKAEAWYEVRRYEAPGFKGTTDESSEVFIEGRRVVQFGVRTGDFEKKELALVETPEGFRVAWEAWVGWSEMDWEDFQKQKPAEAKLFRVICSPSDYYNFGFKDETAWISFRLDSADGEHSVYGYVPAGSPLAAQLRPLDGVERRPVILTLKYPPDSSADNQVIIEKITGSGWVDLPSEP